MGTWGDGLYDNDSALDTLWTFVKIDDFEQDAARLAARIGLLAWLNPITSERSFWWKYVRRVRGGFDLLLPSPPNLRPRKTPRPQNQSAASPNPPSR